MAIVATELQPARKGFIVNATSADASGGEDLLGAVLGKSHYIESITITCISAITVQIRDSSAPDVILLGPVPFAATSSPLIVTYTDPIKVNEFEPIVVETSGAGAICVVIQGYTE